MVRQTELTLEELKELLVGAPDSCRQGHRILPTGLLVNEIGVLFLDKNADAEGTLRDLLEDPRESVRWISWKYLTRGTPVSPETTAALAAFRENPQNDAIVSGYA